MALEALYFPTVLKLSIKSYYYNEYIMYCNGKMIFVINFIESTTHLHKYMMLALF